MKCKLLVAEDELIERYYDPSMFVDYKADVEKPLPMIYQSGYLTIKEYDSRCCLLTTSWQRFPK